MLSPCTYNAYIMHVCGKSAQLINYIIIVTIGQNCSAVCTNKGGHRAAFSNERRKVPCVSRGLLSRPRATEPQVKQNMRSCSNSPLQWRYSCSARTSNLPQRTEASTGVVYKVIGSKFVLVYALC